MRWVVCADEDGGGRLALLAEPAPSPSAASPSAHDPDARPAAEVTVAEVRDVPDLPSAIRELESTHRPRWIWADTARLYPGLLRAGIRISRCHDVVLVDEILAARAGRFGAPRTLGAAYARLHDLPVPDVGRMTAATEAVGGGGPQQDALFSADDTGLPTEVEPLSALIEVYQAQLAELDAAGREVRLLAAAESAGGLAAAEMTHAGLPLDPGLHSANLTEALGPMPAFAGPGARPAKLQTLVEHVAEAFRTPALNPDSPTQLLKALSTNGLPAHTTRAWELRGLEHPGVPLLLEYKELARLYSANGWTWLRAWVRDGRFRPEYVVGGVVTGRWASRGGGALQLPAMVRRAVVADPGWTFVVADAGQLEPRVLAAMSGDRGLATAAQAEDLYTELGDVFGGDRAKAKLGMLGAMYGQTSGEVGPLLATLRRRFPRAIGLVDDAAKSGIEGRVVHTRLGRACPPPSARWNRLVAGAEGEAKADQVRHDRGRFTRNFVVQGTAAEWALALIATLRQKLADSPAELVFFLHDEVVLHCAGSEAEHVRAAVTESALEAARLVFGSTPVRFPLHLATVPCYADAK
ncbi:bifunctional 3'-5' exonuclease/DNA polymerase [Actinospica sp.]|uniref:bifunctional 3'-5' exonuclease/DNA polymerase n=1 Tax=Actinospica sp. TaxID=1872142 RepID=UPI002C20B6AA|nr:bifunctional 3'-5' exonuclease/DNA polymerase [Actinospica sp.]HWG22553.1 bifunctional 3'-5' exonuclease/DNA polymerase [Actinospica sp.]